VTFRSLQALNPSRKRNFIHNNSALLLLSFFSAREFAPFSRGEKGEEELRGEKETKPNTIFQPYVNPTNLHIN
jgi:hypothetical protein